MPAKTAKSARTATTAKKPTRAPAARAAKPAKASTRKPAKTATTKSAKSTTKSAKSTTAKKSRPASDKPSRAAAPAGSPWASHPALAPGRRFWLMKSEPETFSIDDLADKRSTPWEGVRNYTARNFMRDYMQVGDGVLFYHSSTTPPGVVGLARVASAPYPDPTAFDPASPYFDEKSKPAEPQWMLVDVGFVEKLPAPVPLEQLRDDPALRGILVTQRGQRLSVQPVERAHFEHVARLGAATRLAELLLGEA